MIAGFFFMLCTLLISSKHPTGEVICHEYGPYDTYAICERAAHAMSTSESSECYKVSR